MEATTSTFRRPLAVIAWGLLAAISLMAGCSDYVSDGSDVGSMNVVYGDTYYGSGAYSSWGYYGSPYYGYGGGGAVIVSPPRPSAPRPTPH